MEMKKKTRPCASARCCCRCSRRTIHRSPPAEGPRGGWSSSTVGRVRGSKKTGFGARGRSSRCPPSCGRERHSVATQMRAASSPYTSTGSAARGSLPRGSRSPLLRFRWSKVGLRLSYRPVELCGETYGSNRSGGGSSAFGLPSRGEDHTLVHDQGDTKNRQKNNLAKK